MQFWRKQKHICSHAHDRLPVFCVNTFSVRSIKYTLPYRSSSFIGSSWNFGRFPAKIWKLPSALPWRNKFSPCMQDNWFLSGVVIYLYCHISAKIPALCSFACGSAIKSCIRRQKLAMEGQCGASNHSISFTVAFQHITSVLQYHPTADIITVPVV